MLTYVQFILSKPVSYEMLDIFILSISEFSL